MDYQVEHLFSLQCELGEGPRWDVQTQTLYWVDIMAGTFYRMPYATGQYQRFEVGMPIGVLAVRENGGLIMATKEGFARWDFDHQKIELVINPEPDKPNNRFNDGLIDSRGRFWAGSMSLDETDTMPHGSLYRLDPDGTVSVHEKGLFISNGLGWSPDNRTMYLVDSTIKIIYAYDYDEEAGTISNRRPFVHTPELDYGPDGLTVDSEGFVWAAQWHGSRIIRFDPTGQIDREILLPVVSPSCPVFGGPDLTELYVTSARKVIPADQRAAHPLDGDLFRIKTDIKGQPAHRFKG